MRLLRCGRYSRGHLHEHYTNNNIDTILDVLLCFGIGDDAFHKYGDGQDALDDVCNEEVESLQFHAREEYDFGEIEDGGDRAQEEEEIYAFSPFPTMSNVRAVGG